MTGEMRYFVGLDLGQPCEWTALAVLERPLVHPGAAREQRRPVYALRHLHRFPLGTPYPEIAAAVVQLLCTPPLPGALVGVDRTGVGRSVIGMLTDALTGNATCRLAQVTITAGHRVTAGGGFFVPKKELVGSLQVLLQARRLQIAQSLPDADTLVRELQTFRFKVTVAQADEAESWREGAHDDLVFAAAIAAWMGEQGLPPLVDEPVPVPKQYIA